MSELKCSSVKQNEATVFICNHDISYRSLPSIKVIFGTYQFDLKPDDLFIQYNSTKIIFAIYTSNSGSDINEDWFLWDHL